MVGGLERGRNAFARRAWGEAYAQLSGADRKSDLEPEDVERLATATYLVGKDEESSAFWARAYQSLADRDDPEGAIRCAFWLILALLLRGEVAAANGWLARSDRLLDDGYPDCAAHGYVLIPVAIQSMFGGDAESASETFARALAIGVRFREPDLATIARLGHGQTLIMLERTAQGMALLDEAMIDATTGVVSPILVGLAYCIVIEQCHDVFDVRRAQEWTSTLGRWCALQPDLVPYRGQCLVHRSEILRLRGSWQEAEEEVRQAVEWLVDPPGQPAIGLAYYQRGELHRLRGEFAEAEEAYRRADEFGRMAQPGLALLRLAQGQVEAAASAMRRVMGEVQDRVTRSKVLPATVEIMLAIGDVPAARVAAEELSEIAVALDAPLLRALSAQAVGAVLLGEGDAKAALAALRQSWTSWRELDVPHEAARVRILIGLACRQLGDRDTESMEFDAARRVFLQLGAAPDLARMEQLIRSPSAKSTGGLTAREMEVLALVAAGQTNREIAATLIISEHTVARHVQNIFTKLDVSSRTAAGAYAYEHNLV